MAARLEGLQYDSPLPFTRRQRIMLGVGTPLLAATAWLLDRTCRHEVLGLEHLERARSSGRGMVVAVWHESIILGATYYRGSGIHTLASYSFDAEWGARAMEYLGILSIRGSSSKGGSQALRNLAAAIERGSNAILTMDGPRGPRRVAKPGAAILAARTGTVIVPHAFAALPAWRLRSWDRLSIPKPFSRTVSLFAPAIPAPRDDSPAAVEETRLLVEASLNTAHKELEIMLGIDDGALGRLPKKAVPSDTPVGR